MYFNRKCKITYISHGATIHSEEARLSDALNYPPLSESGVEEMERLVNYLKERRIKNDAIYSSPSVRTIQSAMMVSKQFKTDYEIVEDLTTRKYGIWNGLNFDQIENKYPEQFRDFFSNPESKVVEGSESAVEFIERVGKSIEKLVSENIGNRIIVVTHPDVIQAAIVYSLQLAPDKLHKFYIRTGSATQISYFEKWSSLTYCDYTPL